MRLRTPALAAFALTCAIGALPAFAETKSFNITGFTKIQASAAFKIEFTQGSQWSVVVESKYDNMDKIIVEKVGDTLRISRPKNTNLHHEVEDIIRITAPDLDALDLNAAVSFTSPKLNIDNLRIDANAAIKINIASLTAKTIDVHADAASNFTAAGTCEKLNLVLGAATHIKAADLKCREATVSAGTASAVEAYASEKATATAGVSSSVLISGHPKDFQKSVDRFASHVGLAN